MLEKSPLLPLCHIVGQRIAGQTVALSAEQTGPCQVDFLNVAILVEGGIAHRRGLVKVDIAVVELLQTPILGFELAPLDLKLVKESFDLVRRTIIGRQNYNTPSYGGAAGIPVAIVTAVVISVVKHPKAKTFAKTHPLASIHPG